MTMSKILLLIGVYMCLVDGYSAQKLDFPYGLTYHEHDNHDGNWSVDGTVQLSESDLVMFEPKLDVQMCSTTCTIDLSKCSINEDEHHLPNTCYCTKKSGNELSVHVGSLARPADSGMLVQAVLPTKEVFKPVTASRIIGQVPTIAQTIVKFNKVPNKVQIGLTKTMKMTCEVRQNNGKPQSVTSLAITHNGDKVIAKMTDSDDVKADTDLSNLVVKGEVSKKTNKLAFIEVTWESPTNNQIGIYECKVEAMDSNGDIINLSSTLEVNAFPPTMDEMVKHIHSLENENHKMSTKFENENHKMSTMFSQINTRIHEINSEKKMIKTELAAVKKDNNEKEKSMKEIKIIVDQLSRRINKLESEKKTTKVELEAIKKSAETKSEKLKELTSQDTLIIKDLTSLKSEVVQNSSPKHVESGKMQCGASENWQKSNIHLGYERHTHPTLLNNMTIKFKQPYSKPPTVHLSVDYVDLDGKYNTRYIVFLGKVDRYGFNVLCQTWNGSIVYEIMFSWLGIASEE